MLGAAVGCMQVDTYMAHAWGSNQVSRLCCHPAGACNVLSRSPLRSSPHAARAQPNVARNVLIPCGGQVPAWWTLWSCRRACRTAHPLKCTPSGTLHSSVQPRPPPGGRSGVAGGPAEQHTRSNAPRVAHSTPLCSPSPRLVDALQLLAGLPNHKNAQTRPLNAHSSVQARPPPGGRSGVLGRPAQQQAGADPSRLPLVLLQAERAGGGSGAAAGVSWRRQR